jgi:hypothetical protein
VSERQQSCCSFDGTAFLIRALGSLVQVCKDPGKVHSQAIDFEPGAEPAERECSAGFSAQIAGTPTLAAVARSAWFNSAFARRLIAAAVFPKPCTNWR